MGRARNLVAPVYSIGHHEPHLRSLLTNLRLAERRLAVCRNNPCRQGEAWEARREITSIKRELEMAKEHGAAPHQSAQRPNP